MKWFLLLLLSFSAEAIVLKSNPNITPGSLCSKDSKDFLELRYKEQVAVCKRNVSVSLKDKVYAAYQVPVDQRALYTIDHKISLFLGGSNNQDNLWPQLREISSANLEQKTFLLLKDEVLSLEQAKSLILSIK